MKIIDLTHPFAGNMPTYPCDPVPTLREIASIGKEGHADHKLETTLHVGTHIDAPAHMIEGGKKISELPADLFCGNGVVVDARQKEKLDIEILGHKEIRKEDIVLFCTGRSGRYREPIYFSDFPMMTEALARALVERGVKMIGLDTPSPDRTPYMAHKILLAADILIIENLTNLEALLPVKHFDILALPLNLDADAALARVVAAVL